MRLRCFGFALKGLPNVEGIEVATQWQRSMLVYMLHPTATRPCSGSAGGCMKTLLATLNVNQRYKFSSWLSEQVLSFTSTRSSKLSEIRCCLAGDLTKCLVLSGKSTRPEIPKPYTLCRKPTP